MRIGRHPTLLDRLRPAERDRLLGEASRRHLRRGQILFSQGEPHGEVYVLLSGRLRLCYRNAEGKSVTFAYWPAGAMVGSPAVHSHQWTGEAAEDMTLLAIDSARFLALMEEMPRLALGAVSALEFKCKALAHMVQLLSTAQVSERLRLWLSNALDLYSHAGADGVPVIAPFTQTEVAEMLGASRQWVARELGRLQRDGVIRTGKGRIAVLRPGHFAPAAEEGPQPRRYRPPPVDAARQLASAGTVK